MSGDLDLEQLCRRVLRLLPGSLPGQLGTGHGRRLAGSSPTDDPEEDEYIIEFGEPKWPEVAGLAGLAARLYLGGAGAPRRYLAPAAASYDAPGRLNPGDEGHPLVGMHERALAPCGPRRSSVEVRGRHVAGVVRAG